MLEINPLVETERRQAAGARQQDELRFDNALFRHPDIEALRDESEEDPMELEARSTT